MFSLLFFVTAFIVSLFLFAPPPFNRFSSLYFILSLILCLVFPVTQDWLIFLSSTASGIPFYIYFLAFRNLLHYLACCVVLEGLWLWLCSSLFLILCLIPYCYRPCNFLSLFSSRFLVYLTFVLTVFILLPFSNRCLSSVVRFSPWWLRSYDKLCQVCFFVDLFACVCRGHGLGVMMIDMVSVTAGWSLLFQVVSCCCWLVCFALLVFVFILCYYFYF